MSRNVFANVAPLSKQDLDALQSSGTISVDSAQSYRVKRRYLQRSSDESALSEDDMVTLPLDPVSLATGLYLGFSERGAQDMLDTYARLQENGFFTDSHTEHFPAIIITIITQRLENIGTSFDWPWLLRDRIGLHDDIIQRMLDPAWDSIRLCEQPGYWVLGLLEQRAFDLHQNIISLKNGSAGPEGITQSSRERFVSPSSSSQTISHAPTATSQASQAVTHGSGPDNSGASSAPGFTFLYKGLTEVQARKFFPQMTSTQRPWCFTTGSPPPTDFAGRKLLQCWTPQFMVANHYARYKLAIDGSSQSVCVLRIAVPNSWIESRSHLVLEYPSDLFKQVVWHCRKGEPLSKRNVPQALGHNFFIGDIVTGDNAKFETMQSWTDISERELLAIHRDPRIEGAGSAGNEHARQYAFTDDIALELEELEPQPGISVLHFESGRELVIPRPSTA